MAAALKNPHNETVALDIKVELSLGLILTAIHRDKVFWTSQVGNVAAGMQTLAVCLHKLPWLQQGCASLEQAPGHSEGCEQEQSSPSLPCVWRAMPQHDDDFWGLGRFLCHHQFPATGCSLPRVTPWRCASSQASQHTAGCCGYSWGLTWWQWRGEGRVDHGLCWPSSSGGVD